MRPGHDRGCLDAPPTRVETLRVNHVPYYLRRITRRFKLNRTSASLVDAELSSRSLTGGGGRRGEGGGRARIRHSLHVAMNPNAASI